MRNRKDAHLTSRAEGTHRLTIDDLRLTLGRLCALGALCVWAVLLSGCALDTFVRNFSADASGHDPELHFMWRAETGLVIALANVDGGADVSGEQVAATGPAEPAGEAPPVAEDEDQSGN